MVAASRSRSDCIDVGQRLQPLDAGVPGLNGQASGEIDLAANHFELFGEPVGFSIDVERLAERFRRLQSITHPDRFAAAGDAERRWSLQASARVNDAWTTLRRPLARAIYLLSLQGVATDEETDTHMDPAFLMEQMELREALGDARGAADPGAALDAVTRRLDGMGRGCADRFVDRSEAADWAGARDVVREWQFVDKLERETAALAAALDDELS